MNIHSYQTIHGYHKMNLTLAKLSSGTGSSINQPLANQHGKDVNFYRNQHQEAQPITNSTQITLIICHIVHYNM